MLSNEAAKTMVEQANSSFVTLHIGEQGPFTQGVSLYSIGVLCNVEETIWEKFVTEVTSGIDKPTTIMSPSSDSQDCDEYYHVLEIKPWPMCWWFNHAW